MLMEITSSERIENALSGYFQRNIRMRINNDVYKKGKFILISNAVLGNNYFFEFYIEREKKIDVVKIPYPFKWENHLDDSVVFFDYRVSSMTNNKKLAASLKQLVLNSELEDKSKLLDNILEIEFY